MILSVSRRTDIPAFFTPWFMKRLEDGFVMVRNPMNYHQISKIKLTPDVVDCIVFWTKNPLPLLPHLDKIAEKYPFYFQYTLNAYEKDMEPNLPNLEKKLETFKKLSAKVGSERVLWRYDPILLSSKYNLEWHKEQFERLAYELAPYTSTCIFSFVDLYDKVVRNNKLTDIYSCSAEDMDKLAQHFASIGAKLGLKLKTCAEKVDLNQYGIEHSHCIDAELISKLVGCPIGGVKDKNQRMECGCLESVEIGQYDTCSHGCKYCYANFNNKKVQTSLKSYDVNSPLLIGNIDENSKISERKVKSLKNYAAAEQKLF